MIVACIITYNDIETIKDCIGSIENKVDKIIVVDGKFRDFPGSSKLSNGYADGYLFDLQCRRKIELIRAPNYHEVEKRNLYLSCLQDDDICLNLDADEILVGNIPKLTTDIGIINIGEQGDRHRHRRTNRFFRYKKGLHYWGKHSLILDSENKVFADLDKTGNDYTSQKITEFELLHRNDLRSDERKADKKKYYEILMRREAKVNVPAN